MVKKLIAICLIMCSLSCMAKETSEFIDSLVSVMTIKEKIGQLNQLHCEDWIKLENETRKGNVGSVMSITDPVKYNQIQRIAIEESRLGIPLINARDVIHGFKTIFPIPLGMAASFNPELVEQCASIAAKEATTSGIKWTFAPMVDITHDPRWGRIAEGFGEDPFLCSVMGAASVKGFQGNNLKSWQSMAACAKHFAGYGAAEGGRDYNSTFISPNRMRNLYLRPFHSCVMNGVASIMTSFNDNDGVPSSANKWLLKDILRDEWSFDGVVVSDWCSISEMIDHGFCQDKKEAALKSFNSGMDIDMMSESFSENLEELLEEGKISLEDMDKAVKNVLLLKQKLGLFENPYVDETRIDSIDFIVHLELSQKAAEESIVLLKNDGILPLDFTDKKILLTGPLSDALAEQLGTWIFDGDRSLSRTPLNALGRLIGEENVIFMPILDYSREIKDINFEDLQEKTKDIDIIIAVIGEEAILSGEAHSLSNLKLQGAQTKLIKELEKLDKPLISVIIAGRPLVIEEEVEASDAVLYCFAPGSMTGPAIINTLTGANNPSAKLPVTFPRNEGQIPLYYNHNNTGRPTTGQEIYLQEIPVGIEQTALGNKSYYLDYNNPLFPFGYGLSYTKFDYSELKTDKKDYNLNDIIEVSFILNNSGDYDGTEITQLYFRDPYAKITRPILELIGFERVNLAKGEKQICSFSIPVESLKYWDGENWSLEPGEIELFIGGCSDNLLKTSITIL